MKHRRHIGIIAFVTIMSPAIAFANAGPPIAIQAYIHLVFLTWVIGLGEGFLLYLLFRAWRLPTRTSRIFKSMIAANIASACLGMVFISSAYTARIMGDVTIENFEPAFWKMVYATFALTVVIEFPFFLYALYGRKWLVPKAVATTLIAHAISYTLLFGWYTPHYLEESLTSYKASFLHQAFSCVPPKLEKLPALEVVAASAFEMKEDYDLYYISPDGKQVLRSDLAGNHREVIATLNTDIMPDRLYAGPRKVIEETKEEKDKEDHETTQGLLQSDSQGQIPEKKHKEDHKTTQVLLNLDTQGGIPEKEDKEDHEIIQRVCLECGFDLYVLADYVGGRDYGYQYKKLIVENFSPRAAVMMRDGEYDGEWDTKTDFERTFRSFGDAEKWEFSTDFWPRLILHRVKSKPEPHTTATGQRGYAQDFTANRDALYLTQTPIINWPIRNGTRIAGDYGVFQLGKDQICILDPENKRIALIARGFGPVVAKPHAEAPAEEVKE